MKRNASAVWQGSLKEGKGTITTQSGTLKETPYTFRSRFGEDPETNPEELIAAAHAGCFTMALSLALGEAGFTADTLSTKATLSLDQVDGGFAITTVHLDLAGKVPGIDQAKFEEVANGAKAGCPVSKVLNAKITLTATLEQ
ncbi:MAG: OsmC family protein [Chthoniobacteraceae bacterium]